MIREVSESLLDAPERYIIHQCNCLTNHSAGLAQRVFAKFPYSNIYALRGNPHTPGPGEGMGDIIVCGNGEDQRFVINALAQYYPGRPKFPLSKRDGVEARKQAFATCLEKVAALAGITSIAFPDHIGCTMAGGDWTAYRAMIEGWAEQHPMIDVCLRKYE